MKALLIRKWFLSNCTLGEFYLDNVFMCYILEDVDREDGVKIPGETCIPDGLECFIGRVYSPHLRKKVPVIYTEITGNGDSPADFLIRGKGVKFNACEMHVGNFAEDVRGCQAPGLNKDIIHGAVWSSKKACDKIYPLIFAELDKGNVIPYEIRNATVAEMEGFYS